MLRAYCTSSILSICIFALLIPGAVAQDTQHRVLYGQGVHAYNNGDYESTIRYLTATISKNTDDPRSYYFRGLANAKLGNDEASLADLKKGAALEAQNNRGVYQISTALQRIQGQPRLQIEKLRKQARLDLVAAEKTRLQARYEQQQNDEVAVLRKPAQTAPSIPADAQTTIRPSNPFAPSNIAGVKSNPTNVTSSKSNPIPGIDDKAPLANVQGNKPAPANPTPPAANNPAPTVTPPANPAPAAPQTGGGGTLGSIFRSLNPFGGNSSNTEPNAENTVDKLKNLIPGLAPAAPAAPAPGGNPFK
ncbi:MAG: hypothetical protein HN617_11240 [Planctomycetaceae bacterium]|nr:hypothetical protein [Planctomycetaceae bacterium]